jgi:hypothetical protein
MPPTSSWRASALTRQPIYGPWQRALITKARAAQATGHPEGGLRIAGQAIDHAAPAERCAWDVPADGFAAAHSF